MGLNRLRFLQMQRMGRGTSATKVPAGSSYERQPAVKAKRKAAEEEAAAKAEAAASQTDRSNEMDGVPFSYMRSKDREKAVQKKASIKRLH